MRRSSEGLKRASSTGDEAAAAGAARWTNSAGAGGDSEEELPPFPFRGAMGKTVECWYGIGGEMELAGEKQAAVQKPRGRGAQTKKVSRGRASLNAAAGKALENNSDAIAHALLTSILSGDWTSAKLLFALADGQIDCENEVVMRRLVTLAEELAAEPEWKGEANTGAVEQGGPAKD